VSAAAAASEAEIKWRSTEADVKELLTERNIAESKTRRTRAGLGHFAK